MVDLLIDEEDARISVQLRRFRDRRAVFSQEISIIKKVDLVSNFSWEIMERGTSS